jgi:hypothetical protein
MGGSLAPQLITLNFSNEIIHFAFNLPAELLTEFPAENRETGDCGLSTETRLSN